MEDYASIFSPDNSTELPVFKLQLCLDEGAIQFFPTLGDLETAVMYPLLTLATDTLQTFPIIHVNTYIQCKITNNKIVRVFSAFPSVLLIKKVYTYDSCMYVCMYGCMDVCMYICMCCLIYGDVGVAGRGKSLSNTTN